MNVNLDSPALLETKYMDVSGTVTLDCQNHLIVCFHVKAAGDVTFALSNVSQGAHILMMLSQDATGGHDYIFPANTEWAGKTKPAWNTSPNGKDNLTMGYDFSTDMWHEMSRGLNTGMTTT